MQVCTKAKQGTTDTVGAAGSTGRCHWVVTSSKVPEPSKWSMLGKVGHVPSV